MAACHHCGKDLNPTSDFGRQDTCSGCGKDSRVCLNCTHYDSSRYNECTEPVADRVVAKDKATFCDYFKPSDKKASFQDKKAQALSAAEALFKKK